MRTDTHAPLQKLATKSAGKLIDKEQVSLWGKKTKRIKEERERVTTEQVVRRHFWTLSLFV